MLKTSRHVRPITSLYVKNWSLVANMSNTSNTYDTREVTWPHQKAYISSQAIPKIRFGTQLTSHCKSSRLMQVPASPQPPLEELLTRTSSFHYKSAQHNIFSRLIAAPRSECLLRRRWHWNPSSLEVHDSLPPSKKKTFLAHLIMWPFSYSRKTPGASRW